MERTSALLQRIGFYTTLVTVALLPVFFLPVTAEYYDFNKQTLLLISSSILLLCWTVSFVIDKQVRIIRNPYGLPLLGLITVWIASTFLRTPNYTDALLEPGQTGTIIALFIFFTSAINFLRTKKDIDLLTYSLTGSVLTLAILGILWGSGLLPKILPTGFLKMPIWSPSGSGFALISLLVMFLPFLLITVVREKANSLKTLLFSITMFLSIIACGLQGYRQFSPQSLYRPLFLPQSVSWTIGLEALKISPLIGTGPSTFVSDFSRFRPISYNLTDNWAVRFSNSSNYYLQLLSTIGILGLVAYLALAVKSLKVLFHILKSRSESPLYSTALASALTTVIIFISQFFIPVTFLSMFILFVLFTLTVASLRQLGSSLVHEANIDIIAASDTGIRTPILPWMSLILSLALVAPSIFFYTKAYLAEIYYQQAITAAAANQGKNTYDSLIKAVTANPFRDVYRVAYSQTNLLLATSISSQPNLTPENRNTVIQLVQQSVREAKNAISLNPIKVSNVENLADIYRNLLNSAQGADAWTVSTYRQAITLDPTNPNLRIALGGVLFALKNYDEAARAFQQAVDLKPNYPNAYYNLAAAYREKGDLQNAIVAMQSVVNTINQTSPDYTKAVTELEDLRKKAGVAVSPTPTPAVKPELEGPQPLPSPKINPPVNLPAELGPETTPAPSVSPTPQP